MAHNTLPNGMNNNNQRISSMIAPANNQMTQNAYDFELMKLMEQERQSIAAQV